MRTMTPEQSARLTDPTALAIHDVYASLAARLPALEVTYAVTFESDTTDLPDLDALIATRRASETVLTVLANYVTAGIDPVERLAEDGSNEAFSAHVRLAIVDAAMALRAAIAARYARPAPHVHAEYTECDDAACGCHPPEPASMVDEPDVCARCHGRGILVPDCVDNHAQAMAAARECQDCDGLGEVYPDQRVGLTAMASEPVEALPVEVPHG